MSLSFRKINRKNMEIDNQHSFAQILSALQNQKKENKYLEKQLMSERYKYDKIICELMSDIRHKSNKIVSLSKNVSTLKSDLDKNNITSTLSYIINEKKEKKNLKQTQKALQYTDIMLQCKEIKQPIQSIKQTLKSQIKFMENDFDAIWDKLKHFIATINKNGIKKTTKIADLEQTTIELNDLCVQQNQMIEKLHIQLKKTAVPKKKKINNKKKKIGTIKKKEFVNRPCRENKNKNKNKSINRSKSSSRFIKSRKRSSSLNDWDDNNNNDDNLNTNQYIKVLLNKVESDCVEKLKLKSDIKFAQIGIKQCRDDFNQLKREWKINAYNFENDYYDMMQYIVDNVYNIQQSSKTKIKVINNQNKMDQKMQRKLQYYQTEFGKQQNRLQTLEKEMKVFREMEKKIKPLQLSNNVLSKQNDQLLSELEEQQMEMISMKNKYIASEKILKQKVETWQHMIEEYGEKNKRLKQQLNEMEVKHQNEIENYKEDIRQYQDEIKELQTQNALNEQMNREGGGGGNNDGNDDRSERSFIKNKIIQSQLIELKQLQNQQNNSLKIATEILNIINVDDIDTKIVNLNDLIDTVSQKVIGKNKEEANDKNIEINKLEMEFYHLCNGAMQKLLNQQSQYKFDAKKIEELTLNLQTLQTKLQQFESKKVDENDEKNENEQSEDWKEKYKEDVSFLNEIVENKEMTVDNLKQHIHRIQTELQQLQQAENIQNIEQLRQKIEKLTEKCISMDVSNETMDEYKQFVVKLKLFNDQIHEIGTKIQSLTKASTPIDPLKEIQSPRKQRKGSLSLSKSPQQQRESKLHLPHHIQAKPRQRAINFFKKLSVIFNNENKLKCDSFEIIQLIRNEGAVMSRKEYDTPIDELGNTFLHKSIEIAAIDLAQEILSHDANPNIQNIYGDSILHELCSKLHLHKKFILLFESIINSNKANLRIVNNEHKTCLEMITYPTTQRAVLNLLQNATNNINTKFGIKQLKEIIEKEQFRMRNTIIS